MGIFRRKSVQPVPLTMPVETEIPLPDPRILTRMHDDVVRVNAAAAEAATSAMRAREPDGGLTAGLVKQWWPDPEIRERSAPAVYMYVLMGIAFAAIEESQEHSAASEINPFMYTCLAWEGMRIPEGIGDETLRYHCSYALRAGYYLGRMRDKVDPEHVLPGLVANCDVEDEPRS